MSNEFETHDDLPPVIAAHHEAGHAAVAIHQGFTVAHLRAFPGESDGEMDQGLCELVPTIPMQANSRADYQQCTPEQLHQIAVYHMAGAMAEAEYRRRNGFPDRETLSDHSTDDKLVIETCAKEIRSRSALRGEPTAGYTTRGEELQAVIARIREGAQTSVRACWPAIEAIAAAVEGTEIDGGRVAQIYQSAMTSSLPLPDG